MRIVVLDGYTLNPGDLSWDELKALGPCAIYDRTAPEQLLSRAGGAEILLTNKTGLTRASLNALPGLRYIGVLATGTNVVDLAAARERGIVVTNVPAYSTASVAQTVFALLLELTQHVGQHAAGVRSGRWSRCPDWSYWEVPLLELAGLTLGIVGFGRIGQAVGEIGKGFGMEVIASIRQPKPLPPWVRPVALETLFRTGDVITLHCPLNTETAKLVNARRLAEMKPTALLINTSRGGLVDEAALSEALNAGRLAGAGLDVLTEEPPAADNPLLRARNCFITPHLAWGTAAARARLMRAAVQNIRAFLAGSPENVVN